MGSGRRTAVAASALALLLALGLLTLGQPAATAAEPTGTQPSGPSRVLRFDSAEVSGPAGARTAVRRWRTTRIPFYESLPAKWDWSLSTAVAKWNRTGARIKFVRVAERDRAKLVIGYGDVGSAAGRATIGPARPAWVRLSNAYRDVDPLPRFNRVAVMAVLAHELGHVLGFAHTSTTCALMAPTLDFDRCGVLPPERPGHYKCQIIDLPLARAEVAVYGGTARSAGTWCLVEPVPPALAGLGFTGGGDRPVLVRWTPPTSLPSGTVAQLRIRPGGCAAAPSDDRELVTLDPRAGHWNDSAAPATGTHCFSVRTVNRYGVGRPWASATLDRWAALEAPRISDVVWDGSAFHFDAYAPHGVIKFVRDRVDPSACPTEIHDAEYIAWRKDGRATFPPEAKDTCLAFFAADEEQGLVSGLVPVRLVVPTSRG